ncbi:MAG: P-II family nitrogen regulator [Gemmatimonadota bacterium]|nr:P-II family nitrogen regulator [Gemmatimonadota bacterium]
MTWCKVTAIVRGLALERVEEQLERLGVPGVTVTQVQGFGEYRDFFRHDWSVGHARLELFVPRADADRYVHAILKAASTGDAGDGIIAVAPVESVIRIRDGSAALTRSVKAAEEG